MKKHINIYILVLIAVSNFNISAQDTSIIVVQDSLIITAQDSSIIAQQDSSIIAALDSLAIAQQDSLIISTQDNLIISGKIKNNPYKTIDLEDLINQKKIISVQIQNDGNFLLKTKIDNQNFYKLNFDNKNSIILILNPKDSMYIDIDPERFGRPIINGSPNSETIYNIYTELDKFEQKIAESKARIENEKIEYIKKSISENLNSLSSIIFASSLDPKQNIDLLSTLSDSLTKLHPANPFVLELKNQVETVKYLSIGSLAPEITMQTPEDEMLSLSSLRGKVVLIDFWAAWCSPCRKENPNNVKIYNKYKDKGFEIFGVSLDKNKESWVNAIASDNLTWPQVSDLKQWDSEAVKLYKFNGIPFTVLIDEEGKIIEKGLRGADLERKLAEIFGE